MASSADDATTISELDSAIPADNMLVASIGAEIRLVKDIVQTDLSAISGPVTATHTEINTICDGVTATAAEVNALAGASVSSADMAKLAALDATAADINRTCMTLFATVKTGAFTAASNTVYQFDSSGGSIAVTLPSGAAGARIGFQDVGYSASAVNYVRLTPAAGEKLLGTADNTFDIDVPGIPVYFQYAATYGWSLV